MILLRQFDKIGVNDMKIRKIERVYEISDKQLQFALKIPKEESINNISSDNSSTWSIRTIEYRKDGNEKK